MRPDLMGRYRNCLKLNWRMLGHLLAGRLLSGKEVAAGYDRLAAGYAENWLSRLRPVTEEMFALLPEQVAGNILDLGCGTGFTTAELERRYPATPVRAVDISAGMVAEAERLCRRSNFTVGDMLEFLWEEPDGCARADRVGVGARLQRSAPVDPGGGAGAFARRRSGVRGQHP